MEPLSRMFQTTEHSSLLVGLTAADDAAVYQLNEHQAVISTVDFFPPIVDDPYDFGSIAAANALSDIYAMGGQVLFAINLVTFPSALDKSILAEILRGGAEKVAEAGAIIVGGHSVSDKEPKYGLAVTGLIHPDRVKKKGGAQPGDILVLTKPLGVGVITTALKFDKANAEDVAAAVISMKRLNKAASQAAVATGASAMTDITGFGLLGHSYEMAIQGSVDFRFHMARLPWLQGTFSYAISGTFPGGTANNKQYYESHVTFAEGIDLLIQDLLFTPETSGGLLIALTPENLAGFIQLVPDAAVVGEVIQGNGRVWVEK